MASHPMNAFFMPACVVLNSQNRVSRRENTGKARRGCRKEQKRVSASCSCHVTVTPTSPKFTNKQHVQKQASTQVRRRWGEGKVVGRVGVVKEEVG